MSLELEQIEQLKAVAETWAQPPAESVAKLPKPTKRDNKKGRCDECGGWHGLPAVHLDYMGHADVTLALLAVDPTWTLDPVSDPTGIPIVQNQSGRLVMWAHLTILGHSRLCVGTCEASKSDPEKELIGDAIRNGAMRFGIGTRLWSKADSADPGGSGGSGGYETPTDATLLAHPNQARVDRLRAEWEYLTADQRDAGQAWAKEHGKTLTPAAMLKSEGWLEQVEAWVDEQLQAPS